MVPRTSQQAEPFPIQRDDLPFVPGAALKMGVVQAVRHHQQVRAFHGHRLPTLPRAGHRLAGESAIFHPPRRFYAIGQQVRPTASCRQAVSRSNGIAQHVQFPHARFIHSVVRLPFQSKKAPNKAAPKITSAGCTSKSAVNTKATRPINTPSTPCTDFPQIE